MADVQLVIGDAAVNPDLVLQYAQATYNDKIAEFQNRFNGAVEVFPPSIEVSPSTVVNMPTVNMIGAATRRDLTATGDADATAAPDSSQRRAPVRSSVVGPHKFSDAAVRAFKMTPEAVAEKLGAQMAWRIINYRKLSAYHALRGALAALSTSTHTRQRSESANIDDILESRELLGDAATSINVVVMHSKVWKALLLDAGKGASTYLSDSFADMVFIQGGIPALAGCAIIVDDQVPTVAVSAGTRYLTFLLGAGAVKIAPAARCPLFTAEQTISDGRAIKVITEDHFAVGVQGMDYDDSTMNPTDATLYAAGSWGEAFAHDHKDVRAAVLQTIEA